VALGERGLRCDGHVARWRCRVVAWRRR
jgi:hypothetical protein